MYALGFATDRAIGQRSSLPHRNLGNSTCCMCAELVGWTDHDTQRICHGVQSTSQKAKTINRDWQGWTKVIDLMVGKRLRWEIIIMRYVCFQDVKDGSRESHKNRWDCGHETDWSFGKVGQSRFLRDDFQSRITGE